MLLTNKEDALERLSAYQADLLSSRRRQRRRRHRGPSWASGRREESPFEALRPLRKNESAAMVEAARQYRAQRQTRADKLKEMKAAGLKIDSSLINKAIPIVQDSRFDHILLVEPYIAQLEDQNERGYQHARRRVAEQEDTLRAQGRELDGLRRWRDQKLASEVAASHRGETNGATEETPSL